LLGDEIASLIINKWFKRRDAGERITTTPNRVVAINVEENKAPDVAVIVNPPQVCNHDSADNLRVYACADCKLSPAIAGYRFGGIIRLEFCDICVQKPENRPELADNDHVTLTFNPAHIPCNQCVQRPLCQFEEHCNEFVDTVTLDGNLKYCLNHAILKKENKDISGYRKIKFANPDQQNPENDPPFADQPAVCNLRQHNRDLRVGSCIKCNERIANSGSIHFRPERSIIHLLYCQECSRNLSDASAGKCQKCQEDVNTMITIDFEEIDGCKEHVKRPHCESQSCSKQATVIDRDRHFRCDQHAREINGGKGCKIFYGINAS